MVRLTVLYGNPADRSGQATAADMANLVADNITMMVSEAR